MPPRPARRAQVLGVVGKPLTTSLRSWFARGEDAGALLPVLQAYMGHASIAGTDYYLRLTAESYPHIIARVQRAFGDVVPPLKAGPCDGD